MGVSIAVSGAIASAEVRRDLLGWMRKRASELEWGSRAVDLSFKQARLRARGRLTLLEMPRAQGISFLPHFACEELPLVFLEQDGTLVDEVVDDYATDNPTFLAGTLFKTQFAGPTVHREVCDVLGEVRQRFAPDLVIDDETGYLVTHDGAAVARAFEQGWTEIRDKVRADRPAVGAEFQVGEFPFRVPEAEPSGEFAWAPDQESAVVSCERAFVGRFGGFGTTLDRSRASVLDLELAISDVDESKVRKSGDDPELRDVVLQSGAYFGRTLVATLGGAWKIEGGRLVVGDVGRSGLIVDPFQVARDRIEHGPVYGFDRHFDVFETLARNFGREPAA